MCRLDDLLEFISNDIVTCVFDIDSTRGEGTCILLTIPRSVARHMDGEAVKGSQVNVQEVYDGESDDR